MQEFRDFSAILAGIVAILFYRIIIYCWQGKNHGIFTGSLQPGKSGYALAKKRIAEYFPDP
jgi:hypothetical protein